MSESNSHSTDPQTDPDNEAPTGDVLGGEASNTTEKDPDDWVTGDEPMTGAQRSYLDTLARQAGETISADLTKAQASEHIDRLQDATGRGTDS
ncbi:DUF3072 domain-containing protein [Nocardioides sp.]|uniref:DUF3072 domain-containing protein n=1 Tax=Nocardioides sp. TaxID=35761 RepID=UPI0027287AA0|nr:DUF3072 domain-containing protein [Nocardioides sp.]MDO9454556.1 DUF3072 domain-containing protein [Nocardioides sp.]